MEISVAGYFGCRRGPMEDNRRPWVSKVQPLLPIVGIWGSSNNHRHRRRRHRHRGTIIFSLAMVTAVGRTAATNGWNSIDCRSADCIHPNDNGHWWMLEEDRTDELARNSNRISPKPESAFKTFRKNWLRIYFFQFVVVWLVWTWKSTTSALPAKVGDLKLKLGILTTTISVSERD